MGGSSSLKSKTFLFFQKFVFLLAPDDKGRSGVVIRAFASRSVEVGPVSLCSHTTGLKRYL